jgi:hypothetical protein
MYILIGSSYFCLQALNCSIDAGFLHVDKKFFTNMSSKVSQLSIDPSGRFFIHGYVTFCADPQTTDVVALRERRHSPEVEVAHMCGLPFFT